jgi:glyoxylase-like metal-dependent hydrolase (beta-lactamase superfamily II)
VLQVRALPTVEQIHPGVWSLAVPIPDSPLAYTLVYVFATAAGPVLVDTGWDTDAAWQALVDGLRETGHAVSDVYGALITHAHPDHHGLSGRLLAASGAWVAMHQADAEVVAYHRGAPGAWARQSAEAVLHAGASEVELAELPHADDFPTFPVPSSPTRLVADGEHVDVPGWRVQAVWTPGHSPGHLCFVVEQPRLLLSGDHVLARISPHVGLYDETQDRDPLGDYLHSLDALRGLGVDEVLPAHLHRFVDLDARLAELVAHHDERLAAIERLLGDRPRTMWQIAASMPWNRDWDALSPVMKRVALSEALAHLRYLERRHRVERVAGVFPTSYQLCAGSPGLTQVQSPVL